MSFEISSSLKKPDPLLNFPESEWDKEFINIWEYNDLEPKPYPVSIRDNMIGESATLIFTNDLSQF